MMESAKVEKKKNTKSVYFTDEETKFISAAAFSNQKSISVYLHDLAMKDVEDNIDKYSKVVGMITSNQKKG